MSLPGPTIDVAHWGRFAAFGAALSAEPAQSEDDARDARDAGDIGGLGSGGPAPVEVSAMRKAVAAMLNELVRRIETALPEALAAAPQAWDRVDHLLTVFDPAMTAQIADVRRTLERVSSAAAPIAQTPSAAHWVRPLPAARAVALEGLILIEAACGLARLCEQRLSSLIRLRVRSGDDDLLPGGRPFLDLAAALKEVARAWA